MSADIVHVFGMHHKLFELFHPISFFEIPRAYSAEVEEGFFCGGVVQDVVEVLDERFTDVGAGAGDGGLVFEVAVDVFKYPWVAEGASGDEEAITVGLFKHLLPAGAIEDVAVAENKDVFGGLLGGFDVVPVSGAPVGLLAGAGVDEDDFRASLFGDLGDEGGIDALFVPAGSDFDGDGDVDGGDDVREDLADELRVFEEP